MPKIIFVDYKGQQRAVDVSVGETVMRGAVDHGVPGIDADCGGLCACATCHVYVEPDWYAKTGARSESEETMLSFAAITQDNSRLACQIVVSEALDGLVVHTPEGQH